jgi:hypothetical protein
LIKKYIQRLKNRIEVESKYIDDNADLEIEHELEEIGNE